MKIISADANNDNKTIMDDNKIAHREIYYKHLVSFPLMYNYLLIVEISFLFCENLCYYNKKTRKYCNKFNEIFCNVFMKSNDL